MTMPDERRNAVNITRQFLLDLLDPKKTPRVPSAIRKEAYRCLKHYPGDYHMDIAREKAPEVFGDWGDFCVGGKPGKNEQAPEPFGDGDWDASIIHSDG